MIDCHEAKLAVQTASICEHRGIRYYATGMEYSKKGQHGIPTWGIVLHDLRANSVIHAPFEEVGIVRWNLPEELVREILKKSRID